MSNGHGVTRATNGRFANAQKQAVISNSTFPIVDKNEFQTHTHSVNPKEEDLGNWIRRMMQSGSGLMPSELEDECARRGMKIKKGDYAALSRIVLLANPSLLR
jgi:hypothetical protein